MRNTEIPVNSKGSKSEKHVRINTKPLSSTKQHGENTKATNLDSGKYSKPTLNSTKQVLQNIKDIKKGKGFNQNDMNCITPTAAAIMQEKLTQKLNFPADRSVFHGLCPVNVNDSVLEIDIEKTCHTKYSVPKHRLERDPEPQLQDFLDPVIPFEQTEGFEDDDENVIQYARFVENISLKHQPPICTTLGNVQTVFHFFD